MNEQGEQTLATGAFGTVTNKRVIYQRAKAWFSGGSRMDIPIRHVTSISLEITRHIFWGLLLLVLGVGTLLIGVGAVFVVFGVLLMWGSPTVILNTAGQDKPRSIGWPWQRDVATQFVEAIRKQLVSQ